MTDDNKPSAPQPKDDLANRLIAGMIGALDIYELQAFNVLLRARELGPLLKVINSLATEIESARPNGNGHAHEPELQRMPGVHDSAMRAAEKATEH